MNTAAFLQNLAAKPKALSNSSHAGLLLQRKCACGAPTASLTGECAECKNRKRLQTKLTIGTSNDPLEQEADRVAEQVLAAPSNPAVSGAPLHIQRLTGQATGQTDTTSVSVDRVLASPGSPLGPALRQDMEQRFGHDFSQVRVHTGAAAEQSAERVNAEAYTVSNSIVFGPGRYAPATLEGRRLIAHELTHVVQQGGTAQALQRRPKRTAEERDAILATAAQAAFTSFDEQIDAQVEAEELLGLDSKRDKDKTYAWQLGRRDKAQIQKSGRLTTKHKQEITVKIRFFRDDAKRAYLQTINAAVSEAADGEQLAEMLAEPGVPGANEQEEAEGLGCDAGKKQFPLLYEGEPERSTCVDIATDKKFFTNYFDNNIASAITYAVPGTTWENVEYGSFNAMVVKYKNGTSEYFMLDAVGNFYYGGPALSLREFFYYKRSGTGMIYPVKDGRLYSSELLTPNIISLKNGLKHTVKDLQGLFTLVQTTGAFANIIASYSIVEGFRVSLQGFRIPRGGKGGGGKGGGGGGDEPGGTGRSPGNGKGGGQPQGSGTPQKMLNSSLQKGTGKLTSDPVHPGMVKRGQAKEGQSMYDFKKASTKPDDQAEVRMADRLTAEGYDVHFRANDKGGDLVVGGVPTDVKHSRGNVATQMSSAAQQGADQVIIDGSTAKLTREQVNAGIQKYESMAGEMVAGESRVRHPKLRELKTAFIVMGDGTIYIYHRDTSLKKAH